MDLIEPAEACFGCKGTLRLGCFASRVEDSSRIFASSASFASFEASFGRPGSRPPSRRVFFVHCHSCLLNVSLSFRFATPGAARCCPSLAEASIVHGAHPMACSLCFVTGVR
jgi:hypothetical protein